MSQSMRMPDGGRIDRSRMISFTYDGRGYTGVAGDTLASALLAHGVHLMGRSFKYHRPRGPVAAGAEEPNALVSVSRGGDRMTPNLRATQVEIYEGLVAKSQNRWPSLAHDIGEVNDLAPNLLNAGFYYKTFMGPSKAWSKIYEPLIRRAAGLGIAPAGPDPDFYAHKYAFCEVLVVGAGPAGLAAALAASQGGERVILCDEGAQAGGSLLDERQAEIGGQPAAQWLRQTLETLRGRANVTLLARTQAFGYYAQNFLGLCERLTDHLAAPASGMPRERMWKVRAGKVIVATGAVERPLVFPDNDRPGVMLAGAARTYVNRYGVLPGQRAVIFAADDSAYGAARDLRAAGIEIAVIADLRANASEFSAQAVKDGFAVMPSTVVTAVKGRMRVAGVQLGRLSPSGTVGDGTSMACDLLLMAGGWTPSVHLFSQSRGALRFDAERQVFLPGEPAQDMECAGACNGAQGIAACIAEGLDIGARVSGSTHVAHPAVTGEIVPCGGFHGAVPHRRPAHKVKAFVDFQNDVTAKDIGLAVQEGFRSIEHVKRYTTSGMATDQGKTSNMNALAITAQRTGRTLPEVGLTTFRPPYTPVTFGAFAGHSRGMMFDPERRTPMHDWAHKQGAVFEDVGMWKRARYFPRPGEDMAAAVMRECRAVRAAAGIFDASTLGKIEVVGPDAAAFLDLLYANSWSKLAPGRCRYGLMLNEAGFVMDDGVIARLAPDRFHVTTTTGGAARVMHHMEDYRQTEFPHLKVWLTSTTEQWAVIAVQGPHARTIIAPLVEGVDLSREAMPHMSFRTGRIAGVPMRLFRVSFTGELGFEINVPAAQGAMVWEAVWREGQQYGLAAYGTETMHVLRAEKGFIIVGQDTDGTVTPDDLGLGGMVGKTKKDFVGMRGGMRPDLVAAGRKQLVGLLTDDPAAVLEEGAQITAMPDPPAGTPALGHVTSSYFSAAQGRSIALALVADGRTRMGHRLHVPMPRQSIGVTLVEPVFLDPEGKRLHG